MLLGIECAESIDREWEWERVERESGGERVVHVGRVRRRCIGGRPTGRAAAAAVGAVAGGGG
jgi:hypothetical protein